MPLIINRRQARFHPRPVLFGGQPRKTPLRLEERVERIKWPRSAPCAAETRKADRRMGLQTFGRGRISRKSPTLIVGKKPNGKSLMKRTEINPRHLLTLGHVALLVISAAALVTGCASKPILQESAAVKEQALSFKPTPG